MVIRHASAVKVVKAGEIVTVTGCLCQIFVRFLEKRRGDKVIIPCHFKASFFTVGHDYF